MSSNNRLINDVVLRCRGSCSGFTDVGHKCHFTMCWKDEMFDNGTVRCYRPQAAVSVIRLQKLSLHGNEKCLIWKLIIFFNHHV